MNNWARGGAITAAVLAVSIAMAGCEREGPAERAGEKLDRGAEKAGDSIERAGDRTRDRVGR